MGWLTVGCGSRARLAFGTLTNDEGSDQVNDGATETTTQPTNTATSDVTLASTTTAASTLVPSAVSVTPAPTQPTLTPVQGKVVDFWGHPVPNVDLDVGGVRAVTASDGSFTALGVESPYDLSMVIHIDGEASETYAWTYEGLAARALVLPVYRGLPPKRATLRLELATTETGSLPCGALAFGGRHGHDAFRIFQASSAPSLVWRGVEAITMNVQTLFWEPSDAGGCDVPSSFTGFRQYERLLEPGGDVTLPIDGPAGSSMVGTRTLQGLASADDAALLSAAVHLRFAGGATLPTVSKSVESDTLFSLPVPVIEGTSVVMSVTRSDDEGYAVAYVSVGSSESDVSLWLPDVPSLALPPDGARVTARDAVFEWPNDGVVRVLGVTRVDAFSAQFVVTMQHEVSLPDLSHLGFSLAPEVAYNWYVEQHGSAPTVDEWLEGGSRLSPFSADFSNPVGPTVTAGQFTRSEVRAITFLAP